MVKRRISKKSAVIAPAPAPAPAVPSEPAFDMVTSPAKLEVADTLELKPLVERSSLSFQSSPPRAFQMPNSVSPAPEIEVGVVAGKL